MGYDEFDENEYVADNIGMTDEVGDLTDEQFEFAVEWAQANYSNYQDIDCDDNGYYDATNWGLMVEMAMETMKDKEEAKV